METDQQNKDAENQTQSSQPIIPQVITAPISDEVIIGKLPRKRSKRKKFIFLGAATLLSTLIFSTAVYGYNVYIPNKPENILKNAINNFSLDKDFKLDVTANLQDSNLYDGQITVWSNKNGNKQIIATSSSIAGSPEAEMIQVGEKAYAKVNYSKDSVTPAAKNEDAKVEFINQNLVRLMNNGEATKLLNKWIEIPDYLKNAVLPSASSTGSVNPKEIDAQLVSFEGTENDGAKKLNKYLVAMKVSDFVNIVSSVMGAGQADSIFGNLSGIDSSVRLEFNVWIDKETKEIVKIGYTGKPTSDVDVSIVLQLDNTAISAPDSTLLPEKYHYSFVNSAIFNGAFQSGVTTKADKERIADLKGMKLAFEIYKRKNGVYPDRYSIAVEQQKILNAEMPGVDHQLFIDPNGKRAGLNGSQYAYVPEDLSSNSNCGPHNGPKCEKFFLVTTLDNGEEFQLNSDN